MGFILVGYIAHFFGGAFLFNAVPHLCAGVMGRSFPSPFAKPPGVGLSSARLNVAWAWINLVIAYVLLVHVTLLQIISFVDVGITMLGGILISFVCAIQFSKSQS